MRPGQNKRLRGRNNNNRKGPNPLTRSYESNGPDVKVRGTAQHIAEKYLQLARDAQSSGDPVMAESYLQHAEHYYRLIAAAHAAQQSQFAQQNGQPRPPVEPEYEEDEEDVINDRFASVAERLPQPQFPQAQPQPQFQPQPQPQSYQERQSFNGEQRPQQDRPPRHERPYQDRNQDRGQDRNQDRNQGGQQYGQGQNYNRDNRRFRDQRPVDPVDARPPEENRAAVIEEPVGLPAFITAPPRPLPSDAPQPDLAPVEADGQQPDAGGYHLRPRRRRRGRPTGLVGAGVEGGDFPTEQGGGEGDGE